MREILFRGKRIDNDEWIYWDRFGRLTDINGKPIRIEINTSALRPYAFYVNELPIIREETVGQFTGLTDNNGKKIFEGDIVKEPYGWVGLVTFCTDGIGSCGCCVPEFDGSEFKAIIKKLDKGVSMSNCLVIGNIHDNPELWEEDMK